MAYKEYCCYALIYIDQKWPLIMVTLSCTCCIIDNVSSQWADWLSGLLKGRSTGLFFFFFLSRAWQSIVDSVTKSQAQLKWLSTQTYTFISCCCSVTQSRPTVWDLTYWSTPGSSVLHYLPEFAQTHVHWVSDAIQPSCPLSSPSAFNLFQPRCLFWWISSMHQVAKVLELQFQHQSFQWIVRVDFL